MRKSILACVVVALAVGTTSATAATLITGKDIKNGTITAADVKRGSITTSRLASGLRERLQRVGSQGGPAGAPGAKGDKGDPGANGLDADKPRVVSADLAHGVKLAPYGDNSQVDGRGGENTVDNGTITFAEPQLAPELGTRAARFAAKDGDPVTDPDAGRSVVLYLPLTGRPLLSTLTYARYQSFVQDRAQAALDFAFKMEVFATGTGTYQTLVFEPYQNGSDVQGQWVEHNVLGGRIWSSKITNPNPCSQSQPCTFAEYLASYPNARVLTTKVMIGQNSGQGWPGFVGWLDDVRLGFNGQTVRYDLGG
jgi:hypothetical protein